MLKSAFQKKFKNVEGYNNGGYSDNSCSRNNATTDSVVSTTKNMLHCSVEDDRTSTNRKKWESEQDVDDDDNEWYENDY